ncbi:hypothetical protein [Dactylosporangium cerinum]
MDSTTERAERAGSTWIDSPATMRASTSSGGSSLFEHSETASSTESGRGAGPEVSAPCELSGPAALPDSVEPAASVAGSGPVGDVAVADVEDAAAASDPIALAGVGTEQPSSLATVDGSRRRRRTAAVVAVVVVLAAIAGGGAFAATRTWEKPSGMLPEQVVPADVASFARFDLQPGVQQRLAFDGLLGKAPGARNSLTGVQRALLAGSGASITLEEAAPWLGDRFGIARWTSPPVPRRSSSRCSKTRTRPSPPYGRKAQTRRASSSVRTTR